MYTLGPGQLNDQARLVSFGEKTLSTNPDSLPALLLLANHYAEANSSAKAISYAQKAVDVAKADAPDADKSSKLSAGAARNIIGWAYFKQDKTAAAITEFKSASSLLKGQDDQQYASSLYGLGSAYGKLNKLTEAREVLTEAVKIQGPLQAMSQDLLTKVNNARSKGK
jgi:tetratricopeptide (TPR) repeat protein